MVDLKWVIVMIILEIVITFAAEMYEGSPPIKIKDGELSENKKHGQDLIDCSIYVSNTTCKCQIVSSALDGTMKLVY